MKFDFDCPVVSEEKMFEECGQRMMMTEAYLYYKLTSEPLAQVS